MYKLFNLPASSSGSQYVTITPPPYERASKCAATAVKMPLASLDAYKFIIVSTISSPPQQPIFLQPCDTNRYRVALVIAQVFVIPYISKAKPYEAVLDRFEQSFGHLLPGSEGLVYVYRERGLTRIANILCDEYETASRLLRRLECDE